MIPEFQQLAKKVDQLVALVRTLRDENADLHRQVVKLSETNGELTERIQEAHDRVSVVLTNSPFETSPFNAVPLTEQESE